MKNQEATVRAVVRAIDGKQAIVEVEQGGCGRCHEEGGCGGHNLTQMFCSTPKTYRVENQIDVGVGERVTVAIAAGNVRKTANLAYILPLTATIAGAAIGAPFGDAGAMILAGVGLIASFFYVRFRARHGAGSIVDRPYIVSRS